MPGIIEDKRQRRWLRIRWSDSITDSLNMKLSIFWELVEAKRV